MSEEKEVKKDNFFKDLYKSVKDLDKYEDFALKDPKNSFKYILKLLLFITCIITIFFTYFIIKNTKSIYSELKNKIPNFSYQKGELIVDSTEPISIEEGYNIIIDTNASEEEIQQYESDKKTDILILKDRFIYMADSSTSGQINYKYTDLFEEYNINEFDKQLVEQYIDNINIISLCLTIYFVVFIWIFILYIFSRTLDVVMLLIIAHIVSRMAKIKIKYAPAFGIAVHSITLSLLLDMIYVIVNLITGFNIKYFNLMYYTIAYIYVVVAILMIKTDLINRQTELIKIANEQEKIKDDPKEDTLEDKEENNENDKSKEKKEKKKKEDKTGEEEPNAHVCNENINQ